MQKKAWKMFEHSNNSVIEMEKMSFLSVVLSAIIAETEASVI